MVEPLSLGVLHLRTTLFFVLEATFGARGLSGQSAGMVSEAPDGGEGMRVWSGEMWEGVVRGGRV